jgi:DNA-directed RNA polymerase II subunit RPB1
MVVSVDVAAVNNLTALPDGKELPPFLEDEDPVLVYLEDVVLPQVLDTPISGLEGIADYFIEPGFTVRTRGNNFLGLLGTPCLDETTVMSNNMWDIYHCLGIEAANAWLLRELGSITSADDTYMNPAHLMLLVDVMTSHGTIVSISRYALKKEQVGPLAKASFEESLDNFLKAGMFVDTDDTRGVSASIMCGKRSKVGTGMMDLLFDIPK